MSAEINEDDITIVYLDDKYVHQIREVVDTIAKELIYLEITEARPIEVMIEFEKRLIAMNAPAYLAFHHDKVIGWSFASPFDHPRMNHRASISMGILPAYRGLGIGSKLLQRVIDHAKQSTTIEKLELGVYSENENAKKLYTKMGFIEEGYIKSYRKLNGMVFDHIEMGMILRKDPSYEC